MIKFTFIRNLSFSVGCILLALLSMSMFQYHFQKEFDEKFLGAEKLLWALNRVLVRI